VAEQAYPKTSYSSSHCFSKAPLKPKLLVAREDHVLSRSTIIFAALVESLSLPVQAHDIYLHLKDASGMICCNAMDCRPAPYRFTSGHLQMFVDWRWIEVPDERILYRSLPGDTGETGGGHWCGVSYEPSVGPTDMTRCAILPPQSGSAGNTLLARLSRSLG